MAELGKNSCPQLAGSDQCGLPSTQQGCVSDLDSRVGDPKYGTSAVADLIANSLSISSVWTCDFFGVTHTVSRNFYT